MYECIIQGVPKKNGARKDYEVCEMIMHNNSASIQNSWRKSFLSIILPNKFFEHIGEDLKRKHDHAVKRFSICETKRRVNKM